MHTLPPDVNTDDPARADTHRFRAATFDAAVALANAELGEHVEIVEANRIRRGGLGGFFATDLGVEIVVRPAQPARPQPRPELHGGSAIDRLIALVDAQERAAHEPVDPTDFGAALARELGTPPTAPALSSADWSVEAYRQLRIPATPTEPEPTEPRPRSATGREREMATRVCLAARAAARELHPDEPAPDSDALARDVGAGWLVSPVPDEPAPRSDALARDVGAGSVVSPVPDEPAPNSGALARDVGAGSRGDSAAQTMDLVTQAATALFGQLGNMPVVPGSQAAHVRKLTVSVTSPLGKVIEISAELGA